MYIKKRIGKLISVLGVSALIISGFGASGFNSIGFGNSISDVSAEGIKDVRIQDVQKYVSTVTFDVEVAGNSNGNTSGSTNDNSNGNSDQNGNAPDRYDAGADNNKDSGKDTVKETKHPDGWAEEEEPNRFKYYKDNKALTGWQVIKERKYYFDKDGILQTGFTTVDDKLYYLGTFDFEKTKNGESDYNEVGFLSIQSGNYNMKIYYINDDLTVATGWKTISVGDVGERTFYFDETGAMPEGWIQADGKWYFQNNGENEYGIETNAWVDGYWLGADGAQEYSYTADWSYDSWGWWFEDTSGWYPTDQWARIDGYWYYFDEYGYMTRSSWKNVGGNYFYFNFDGRMVSNAKTRDGEDTGQWIDGYWVDHNGVWTGDTAYWYWDGIGYQLWSSDNTWHAVDTTQIIDKYYVNFDASGYANMYGTRLTTVPPMGGAPSATKNNVIQFASRSLGFPYVYGGQTIAGTDCSGFTMLSYESVGISIPHNAGLQYSTYSSQEVWVSEVQPGDLLFYYSGDIENDNGTGIGHVALYIGNGETLEAGDTTNGHRWYADKAVYVIK